MWIGAAPSVIIDLIFEKNDGSLPVIVTGFFLSLFFRYAFHPLC